MKAKALVTGEHERMDEAEAMRALLILNANLVIAIKKAVIAGLDHDAIRVTLAKAAGTLDEYEEA